MKNKKQTKKISREATVFIKEFYAQPTDNLKWFKKICEKIREVQK